MTRLKERNSKGLCRFFFLVLLVSSALLVAGCGDDKEAGGGNTGVLDETIPENTSWEISTLLKLEGDTVIPPQVEFTHTEGRLFMAWYEENPDGSSGGPYPYRISYQSFPLSQGGVPDISNTKDETVVEIEDLKGLGGLSMTQYAGTPLVAYSVYKKGVSSDSADYNNQGDVVIAVRDGSHNWRNEIAAYGYVSPERNPLLPDGLAGSDFSLAADEKGSAFLAFQFFYEGIDSYNMEFPDLRFIRQPINSFNNLDANAVADDEETVEGNVYYSNGSGIQNFQGGSNELLVDQNGNLVVFYSADNTTSGSKADKGLRIARKTDGAWQAPKWVDKGENGLEGIDVIDISAAVKSDGKLFVVYTIKDAPDLSGEETIPYSLRYAEEVEVVIEDDSGEDKVFLEWQTGIVNHTSINGRFCSLALDSEDNPVIAYFDEMNFTGNRFFSRVKISSRSSKGAWSVNVITPEDIGLSNHTNPYDISPGAHDSYYIGKYNYLWVDGGDRVNICSYSTVTKKVYHFVQK